MAKKRYTGSDRNCKKYINNVRIKDIAIINTFNNVLPVHEKLITPEVTTSIVAAWNNETRFATKIGTLPRFEKYVFLHFLRNSCYFWFHLNIYYIRCSNGSWNAMIHIYRVVRFAFDEYIPQVTRVVSHVDWHVWHKILALKD